MSGNYPILIKLEGKRCLVAGGGEVAYRKVEALLKCGARVTVVSPQLGPGLMQAAQARQIKVLPRAFQPDDLDGVVLAIAATDDPQVNAQVSREAQRRGLLVNVVDDPAACNFIVPSVLRRGDLVIAVSTSGRSPALARNIRQKLEQQFPPEYGAFLDLISQVRQELAARGQRAAPEVWQDSLDTELLELVRQGKTEAARERLVAMLSQPGGSPGERP